MGFSWVLGYDAYALGTMTDGVGCPPLLYIHNVMTWSFCIHSCNDDDDIYSVLTIRCMPLRHDISKVFLDSHKLYY